jgi:hypothetical protein
MGKLKSLKFVEEIILNSREQGTGGVGEGKKFSFCSLFFLFLMNS